MKSLAEHPTPLLAVLLALALPGFALGQTPITIIHVNDTHSHVDSFGPRDASLEGTIGGLERAATLIGRMKATEPNPLFLHAGDAFHGDFFFNALYDVPELAVLKSLGVDAMTVGNHEFDLTPAALTGALNAVAPIEKGGTFPMTSANLDFTADACKAWQPCALLPYWVKPGILKTVGGVRGGDLRPDHPHRPHHAAQAGGRAGRRRGAGRGRGRLAPGAGCEGDRLPLAPGRRRRPGRGVEGRGHRRRGPGPRPRPLRGPGDARRPRGPEGPRRLGRGPLPQRRPAAARVPGGLRRHRDGVGPPAGGRVGGARSPGGGPRGAGEGGDRREVRAVRRRLQGRRRLRAVARLEAVRPRAPGARHRDGQPRHGRAPLAHADADRPHRDRPRLRGPVRGPARGRRPLPPGQLRLRPGRPASASRSRRWTSPAPSCSRAWRSAS